MDTALQKKELTEFIEKQEVDGAKLFAHLFEISNIDNQTCIKLCSGENTEKDEIFFIPGIEGLCSVFSGLATKIEGPSLCLQPGIDSCAQKSFSAFSDTADSFLPVLSNINLIIPEQCL